MKDIHLIISRKTEYWDFVRPYKVYVDGDYLGSLRIGQTKLFLIEKGRHTVRIKQALSFSRSKKYYLEDTDESPIYLEASTSWLGISANALLLFFILFTGLSNHYVWLLDYVFSYLLHFTLLYGIIAFFVFPHRYVVIKPSKHPVELKTS